MERCPQCGGTKAAPAQQVCGFCHGEGAVLSLLPDNPWLDAHPATQTNRARYPAHHQHACPKCDGHGSMPCANAFHL